MLDGLEGNSDLPLPEGAGPWLLTIPLLWVMVALAATARLPGKERGMQPVEASVVVPQSPEETWAFILGGPRRAVEHLADIVAVEDYRVRADETPQ